MTSTSHPKHLALSRLLVSVAVAAALVLVPEIPADAASGWHHEVLDPGISTGEGTSTIYWPPFSQHHVFNVGMESGAPVLRHGWFAPGYGGWKFQTLDAGNSTGRASATGLWEYQHHVFNEGDESGTPMLRHGWYQDGGLGWQFETLDPGVSTGTDTAYADYAGQQHVFTHGISPAGEDILRHGYYDPGVGSWTFETLDAGFSDGSALSTMVWRDQLHYFSGVSNRAQGLRHGWYQPGIGWRFETLVADGVGSGSVGSSSVDATAALVMGDGRQHVWFTVLFTSSTPGVWPRSWTLLGHGWYDESTGVWNFEAPYPGGNGIGPSATTYGEHGEVFDYYSAPVGCDGLFHEFWDGIQWTIEFRPATCGGTIDDLGRSPTATSTFPPYDQLHAFYAQYPPALGHFWYNPA